MQKMLTILALIVIAFFALFFILSLIARSAPPAGMINGQLTQCPEKPNCVCSEYQDDTAHAIAPIQIPEGEEDKALPVIKETILELGGVIQNESETYLASTFTSKFFRFTDDVEIRLDSAEGLLHIRSASRAGYSDMGANQARVILIRALFEQKLKKK